MPKTIEFRIKIEIADSGEFISRTERIEFIQDQLLELDDVEYVEVSPILIPQITVETTSVSKDVPSNLPARINTKKRKRKE